MPTEQPTKTLIIHGAGGHGAVVADAAQRAGLWAQIVVTDRDPTQTSGFALAGLQVAAPAQLLRELPPGADFHIAIGAAGPRRKEAVLWAALLTQPQYAAIVHPGAYLSAHAQLQRGCFIAAGAVVAARAQLGEGVIVNHLAVVDHDCVVGAFSHIAPGARLGGGVKIGVACLVGTGAVVLPGVTLGDGAVIGAGAVVVSDVPADGRYVGVPARPMKVKGVL